MRQIPELEFRDDRSMEHAEQIDRTLRESERVAAVGTPSETDGGDPITARVDRVAGARLAIGPAVDLLAA